MKYLWWEKTVEHLFVTQATRRGQSLVAPLAGRHELAGDMFFTQTARFVLIEFKRSEAELRAERDKFADFDQASAALGKTDSHHLLVYAEPAGEQLILRGRTYFSSA